MMAAAMTSCRVLGGAEGLPLHMRGPKGSNPVSCNGRIVAGRFGSSVRIAPWGKRQSVVAQVCVIRWGVFDLSEPFF